MRRLTAVLLLSYICLNVASESLKSLYFPDEHVILAEDGACLSVDFPMPFKEPVDFNMSEGVGPIRDESADLQCHCMDQRCDCTGTAAEDCDEYAKGWLYFIGTAHQVGAVLYKMSHYNLAGTMYWLVCGGMLAVIGVGTILYMELRAVLVVRQRDERRKLEEIRAMEKSAKLRALEQEESRRMRPRPYVTLTGAAVLFLGMLCQLVPFCHLLRELGLPVAFPGYCMLFVSVFALTLAAASALFIAGCCWTCTRPIAAGVLIVAGLLGDVALLHGGLWACALWGVLAGAGLYVYFQVLPSHFAANGGGPPPPPPPAGSEWEVGGGLPSRPWWLESVGDWTMEADPRRVGEALMGAGDLVTHDVSHNPVMDQARRLAGNGPPTPTATAAAAAAAAGPASV